MSAGEKIDVKTTDDGHKELVLKEYPHSTRWIKGQLILGVGNLVLTNQRLVFLHGVDLTPRQIAYVKKLSEAGNASKVLDYALTLHKKSFEVPLTAVTSVKMAKYCILPFPRPYLKISYRGRGKDKEKALGFMFTIPLLRGFFQLEFTTVFGWSRMIKKAWNAVQPDFER